MSDVVCSLPSLSAQVLGRADLEEWATANSTSEFVVWPLKPGRTYVKAGKLRRDFMRL